VEIHFANMHLPKYQHGGGAKSYVLKFGVDYSISYRLLWNVYSRSFHFARDNLNTVELHLSGLIGTAGHPDMQEIWIIWFFFENRLHWQFKFGCYCLQYVPASKPFDHAWFEVL